ncbi:TetR/AcrR family transcriptional regulator [Siminovitchia terrae]|uniref:TetR/AcrR family transcriptional regulator n=1 Tax=Siminovitchia terrae TaxID=1914933 RepID=UPI001B295B6D|nr:TetR/AcrR family transcriptional regulator [Siminovitchia terrae]GIN89025.1 HTH-type transcriptional regulator PksA [Siminovitchia terrae]
MPKIVDHEKQKQRVAEAAWRVIREEGMEQATVRKIAEEAGMSVGSLRYYFSSQSELFAFSMNLVSERVKERIRSISFSGPPRESMKLLLKELLPMDEEKRFEGEVWFAFTAKALSDKSLLSLSQQVYRELRSVMALIINSLVDQGLALPDLNAELETERLYALIDGLAIHGTLEPGQVTPDLMENIVTAHLKSICKAERTSENG